MKKIILLTLSGLLLASCGGGGGGGGSSSNARQFSNTAPIVNIATAEIPSAGSGTKDFFFTAGVGFSGNILTSDGIQYSNGVAGFGSIIRGNIFGDGSLVVPTPPLDIRTAWDEGWTGEGVNILVADATSHALTVTVSALQTAPRANLYGLNAGIEGTTYLEHGLFDRNGNANLPTDTKIDVINMSFGNNPVQNPNAFRDEYLNDRLFNDLIQGGFLTNAGDAVLTKAAGNDDATNANLAPENLFLATDETTKARVLIVGALDRYAQEGGAAIASYSNLAGDNDAVQRRFLVEYGGSPFAGDAYMCDPAIPNFTGCILAPFSNVRQQGTSFAAPRVAGLAALVRHKFDNLSGAQTAKILLDTATTQGLSCHPNCNVETYGQGRVSITDALSPIGRLR